MRAVSNIKEVFSSGQPTCELTVQEDHMPSYFLAEMCKYAFLIADSTFLKVGPSLCIPAEVSLT